MIVSKFDGEKPGWSSGPAENCSRGLIPNTLVLPHWLALTFSVLIIGGGGRGTWGKNPGPLKNLKIGENDGSSCLDVGTLFSDKLMWWK